MDVASSQRLSGHPTSHDPCLGGSGSRNSSPPQPRPGPLRLSTMRGPRFLFGLRAPLPPGPGARRGRVSERRRKHPLNFGISTRFQQSPHKLSLAPTVQ